MSPANINPTETDLKIQVESSHLLILSLKLVKRKQSVNFLKTEQYNIWHSVPVKCTMLSTVSRQQTLDLSKYKKDDNNYIHLHAVILREGDLYSSQNEQKPF